MFRTSAYIKKITTFIHCFLSNKEKKTFCPNQSEQSSVNRTQDVLWNVLFTVADIAAVSLSACSCAHSSHNMHCTQTSLGAEEMKSSPQTRHSAPLPARGGPLPSLAGSFCGPTGRAFFLLLPSTLPSPPPKPASQGCQGEWQLIFFLPVLCSCLASG